LASAIANIGPISVALDFSSPQLQFYKRGIYYDTKCKKDYENLNHAVVAVGFGQTKQNEKYYIIKNSWSIGWGANGYIYMAREKGNMCGIATDSCYPLV
jgi:C1A family cysteine protease